VCFNNVSAELSRGSPLEFTTGTGVLCTSNIPHNVLTPSRSNLLRGPPAFQSRLSMKSPISLSLSGPLRRLSNGPAYSLADSVESLLTHPLTQTPPQRRSTTTSEMGDAKAICHHMVSCNIRADRAVKATSRGNLGREINKRKCAAKWM
jgi:hypothetical protein